MKLYYSPGACSLSPHIVLRETGLSFDMEQVDLASKKTKSGGDFLTVNQNGQVPTLVLDNGQTLTEGPVIVQYLADQKPAAGFVPAAGTFERYRLQEWLNFIASELHKTFAPLFRPTAPEAFKATAREALGKRFEYLDRHFASKPFLMGDKFSVADAYLFTVLGWTNFLKIDISKWTNLTGYVGRVAARPKVQEVMKAEGLTK